MRADMGRPHPPPAPSLNSGLKKQKHAPACTPSRPARCVCQSRELRRLSRPRTAGGCRSPSRKTARPRRIGRRGGPKRRQARNRASPSRRARLCPANRAVSAREEVGLRVRAFGRAGRPAQIVKKKKSYLALENFRGYRVSSRETTILCQPAPPSIAKNRVCNDVLYWVVTEKEKRSRKKEKQPPPPPINTLKPAPLLHTLAPAPHSSYWLSSNCSASMVESMKSSFSHPAGPAGGACASRTMR